MISPQCVVLFCCLLFSVSNSSPSLCTPGQLSIDGNDVIESHRGYLLLIVYMPLQCSHCHRQLRELSVVAESISDLKIVIVCPGFEAPSLVERLQREFPLLLLQRDADGVFPSRGAQHHDQVLYDRCGRVSHTISHARGELTSYKDTLEAIESARHHAKCGWCQYDSKEGREMARKQQIRKQVNAYLRPNRTERKRSEDGVRRSDVARNGQNNQLRQQQYQQQQSQQQQYQQQTPTQRSQQQPVQQQFQRAQQRQYQQNYQQPTQTYRPQQQRQAQGYSQSGHSAQGTQQQRDYYARQQQDRQTQYGQQQQQQQQQHRQQGQAQSAHYDHNQHYAPRPTSSQVDSQFDQRRSEANYQNRERSQARYPQTPQIHTQNSQNYPERSQPTNQAVSQSQSSSTTGSTENSRNSYGEDGDYEYYEDTIGTTPKTETQIPQPSSFFPTAAMSHFPQSFQNMNSNQFNHQFGQMISEDNIPCAAYTDDICYQQQEKFGAAGLSKCCSKGIYFTDLCVPGKCTNTSVQLCCLQKFLQAKYSCCEDDSQSDNTTSTNKFSKCCYTKFVEKNDCCTVEAAKSYWGSVNEVCYPNTKVDYSTVKIEVIFSEGVRVVDLGENRLWDYECRNGGNRVQYAYLPDSEN